MLHCMARKQKLNQVMSVKTDTLKRTWHPGPIQCETKNFSSCLFRKLSREEKHLFFFSVRTSYSLKLFKRIPGSPCDAIQSSSQGSLLSLR